jgi:hypothetical protein
VYPDEPAEAAEAAEADEADAETVAITYNRSL